MPADSGYVLDFDTVQRIARAVRDYERGIGKPGVSESQSEQLLDGESYLQITSARATAGEYNAIEKIVRPDTGGWQFAPTMCIARETNGAALVVGNTYKGTLKTTFNDSGTVKNVFAVQASGGGGGALSTGLVEIGGQTAPNSQLYNGWICSNGAGEPGTSWVRGDAVYIWNNSSKTNLYPGSRVVAADVGTYNGKRAYATSSGTLNDVVVVTDAQCDFGTINIQKRVIVTKG